MSVQQLGRYEITGKLGEGAMGVVHRAFIACAGKQRDLCKAHFLKAFAINPKFSLNKSETGHPLWGPVYQEARADAAKRK